MSIIKIDEVLVQNLISTQFPQWQNLSIKPIIPGGWDNRSFRLGENMLVRMPSAAEYAAKVAIEQEWLPKLAPHLKVPIPKPLAMGKPGFAYPWNWSIYHWIEGETAATAVIPDLSLLAKDLAEFLLTLHKIPIDDAPTPGEHNFYRGGPLQVYDTETRQALLRLQDKIDTSLAKEIWDLALTSNWEKDPVWVHGDFSVGNFLVENNRLCGVIDFGGMAVGDPACDLVIAWTFFRGYSREIFREELSLDKDTWDRARGWALWKALIVASGLTDSNESEKSHCWNTLTELITDYQLKK